MVTEEELRETPEPVETPTEGKESLEEALSRNLSVLSGQSESTDSSPDTEDGDVPSDEPEAEQVQASDKDSLEPLEKWTDDQKVLFQNLDRQSQQFLLDRNKDVESYLTKETQALSETRKRYERLDEVIKPYIDALRPRGIEVEPHIANALSAYFAYQQDPIKTLKSLVQSAGLTQDQLFEDDSMVDPSIRALRERLDKTERELAKVKSQPIQEQDSSAQKVLDEFVSAKNEDGTEKHPYFGQVKALMAPLVANGKTLEEAYSDTLWTIPEFRSKQVESDKKKALTEIEAKRRDKAKKAKSAGSTLPPSNVDTGTGIKPAKNWSEALQVTLDKLGGN